MKHTDDYYEFFSQLFRAHGANTPSDYAREAYERTECGVWTAFVLPDGREIMSDDLHPIEDSIQWATLHCVGVRHGTIVEGSEAEFKADSLILPFSDEELAECWEYLEGEASAVFEG